MTYTEWAERHPDAARELTVVLMSAAGSAPDPSMGESEVRAQQRVRVSVAEQGGMSWRNNVGATPAKCPSCNAKQRPIRYGLANDSTQLNKRIKSSDLILAIPRQITADMVGTTIAQFGAVECKRPGWQYTGGEREAAQQAWLALIAGLGGFAQFSTGEVTL